MHVTHHPPRASGSRCTAARFAAIAALVAVAVALGTLAWQTNRSARLLASRAGAITSSAQRVLMDLLNTETGQRGFLLTGRAAYLQPYRSGSEAVTADVATLTRLSGSDRALAVDADTLGTLARRKLSELASTVALARSGHRRRALAEVGTDVGKFTMDSARARVADIERAASRLALPARRTADALQKLAIVLDVVLVALALALGAWWRARSRRDRGERDRALNERAGEARLERALRDVAAAAAGGGTEADVAAVAAARVSELLHATTAAVIRAERESLHIVGYSGPTPYPERLGWNEPASAARAVQTGRPARLEQYGPDSGAVGAFVAAQGLRCGISVPVRTPGHVWGCITVTTTRATGFSPLHEQWLERFARLTSAALASAQSQESLRFRVRLEVALRRVASASADGTLDAQRLAELVASEAAELLDASFAAIVRFERADETSVLGHFGEFPFPHSLASEGRATVTGQVARTGQPARIDDYSTIDGSPAAAHGVAGAVGVPLRIGGALWGCMVAMTRRVGGFAPDAEAVLERFAELVCAALANARAHDRLRAQAAVLSSLQDGLVVLDKSGRIIKVNDALCRMTGYGSEELIGASAPYPFSAGAAEDEVAVTEPANPVERTLRRKDGSVLHVAASVANFADSDHTVSGRAAVFTDISHTVFHSHLEQALSEVAAASADGEYEARTLFDLVSDRVANLFDAAAAAVVRFDDQRGTVVGQHGDGELPDAQLDQPGAASRVAGTGEAARIDDYERTSGAFASQMVGAGLRCAVAVPVRVRGALWGCLVVASDRPRGLAADTEQLLERFAALVSVALASADTRATLQRQASTDGLTGLLNHRAFQHSLHEERRRAVRHHRPLALAMFDLDGFKEVNDTHGHQAGDRVLRTVARTFVESKRAGDIAARIGGDEFAVIAPDTDAQDALALAERLRQAAAAALAELQLPVTLSAGVTDLGAASTMHDLFHLADSALYWAKHHGRNQAVRYAPGAGHDVSDELRQRRFERGRTLTGLSALARAVDAKDALTQQHAERVADIAARLAARRGWNPDRCARLREAALLHDVGKIGVPDAILGKPGKLTADEYEQVKGHTLLGARIAGEVLDEEQVRWVRWHHERPDGRGYPDALPRERIPEGALLLGVADAFDAMTAGRPYQAALSPSTALAEMRSHAGTQFDQDLLDLLEQWALGAGPDVANAA